MRRSLVGAGIVALWGALLATIGAPLLGLVLAGAAALVCLVALVRARGLRLPKVSLPKPGLPRLPIRRVPVGRYARRAAAVGPPVARQGRRALAAVPPLADRGAVGVATLARRAAPLVASTAETSGKLRELALAPLERRRQKAALTKEAWRLNAEGVEHRREGRSAAAVEAHERAVALFRQVADDRSEALALNNLGLALMSEGDDVGAIDAFERALALLGRTEDRQSEGRVLANLGTLHRRHDRQEAALTYWREALTRLDEDSPEHERMSELVKLAS